MAQPVSLMTAQVNFLSGRLALIHIPLDIYPYFLQPILQLLFHGVPPIEELHEGDLELPDDTEVPSHPSFLNISITPVECSVACSRELADLYFKPLAEKFNESAPDNASRVSISSEDFVVMQVDGQGLDAGQRVLELTSPLAMAGISIFFISTYFSDYILVPHRSRGQVTEALESRGFSFQGTASAFVDSSNPQYRITPPPSATQRSRPPTPPPSSLSELQARTFASLRKHNIRPRVDKSLRIVQCAAHYQHSDIAPTSPTLLRPSLITTLILDKPRFLSLTLAETDPAASILLEKRLLQRFSFDPTTPFFTNHLGGQGSDLLLGSKDDILVPIMLDLRDLPLEAPGIVCGVAGRLATASQSSEENGSDHEGLKNGHQRHSNGSTTVKVQVEEQYRLQASAEPSFPDAVEISFLSTARAGTVIVGERDLERAMTSLEALNQEQPPESVGNADDNEQEIFMAES